jgi:hypothetical protein
MGTSSSVVLVFFIIIIMMAATLAVLTVAYTTRLPSSKARAQSSVDGKSDGGAGGRPNGREKNRRKSPGNEPTLPAEAAAILTGISGTGASRPADAAAEKVPEERKRRRHVLAASLQRLKGMWPKKKHSLPPVPAEATGRPVDEVPGQSDPVAPVVSAPPEEVRTSEADLKPVPPASPPAQAAPEAETNPSPLTGQVNSVEKEKESTMNTKPAGESPRPAQGPNATAPAAVPQAPPQPGNETQPAEKADLGSLSDLFAKETTEDSKASKLAEGMAEVDLTGLLANGKDLVGRLKKTRV